MRLHEVYVINGIDVTVRREDKRYEPPLPPHAKMSVLDMLCKKAKADGYKMIGCFGSKYSNWILGLPYLAKEHGLKSIICYPAKTLKACPDWLIHLVHNSRVKGFQLHMLHPNMVTINQAQAKNLVTKRGGYFIPFGFDDPYVVDYLSKQFLLPPEIGTLVLSCGSGITLASILRSIRVHGNRVKRIEAVSSGRAVGNIVKTVKQYENIPLTVNWRSIYKYADVPDIECPWPAHNHFELKAYDWLQQNVTRLPKPIYFINIGANS